MYRVSRHSPPVKLASEDTNPTPRVSCGSDKSNDYMNTSSEYKMSRKVKYIFSISVELNSSSAMTLKWDHIFLPPRSGVRERRERDRESECARALACGAAHRLCWSEDAKHLKQQVVTKRRTRQKIDSPPTSNLSLLLHASLCTTPRRTQVWFCRRDFSTSTTRSATVVNSEKCEKKYSSTSIGLVLPDIAKFWFTVIMSHLSGWAQQNINEKYWDQA